MTLITAGLTLLKLSYPGLVLNCPMSSLTKELYEDLYNFDFEEYLRTSSGTYRKLFEKRVTTFIPSFFGWIKDQVRYSPS